MGTVSSIRFRRGAGEQNASSRRLRPQKAKGCRSHAGRAEPRRGRGACSRETDPNRGAADRQLGSDSHPAPCNLNKENPHGQLDEDSNVDGKSPLDFGTAFGTNDPGKPTVRICTMESSPTEMKDVDSSCLEFLKPDNPEKMWIRLQGL
ncbi:hypothetical protein scyTo_0005853 [Scyliorhinus torazame]|uniref:Uncharacterized protein n=1 Tax=Scyliorhinus torazame TaxID=75743 RepID=A0A401PDF4_SCYTO|nr:hypothetical protein [Scyliorhinus torazame]